MAALKSLHPAVTALIRNPILVVLVGLYGVVQLPQLALQSSQPLFAAVFSLGLTGVFIFVMPFVQGGLLGMADEALTGRTGWGTFVADGKSNYVTLLVAYLAIFAVNFVLGIVAFFAFVIGGLGFYMSEGGTNLAGLGIMLGIGVLFVLVYLLVMFFTQFYAHAIVLTDTDLVAGFKRSIGLVRHNLLTVLGYSLILLTGSILFGSIAGVASLLLSPQPTGLPLPDPSLPLLVVAAIVYVVIIAVLGAFYATYSVAFYRSIEDRIPTA
ncbi:DUF7847 domain-containing protein [Halobellus marinus]|uniref:DUF7847 domain-containing protein n=1 Tax=Halobellus TaxID=1073986 RepID=UPI0028AA7ACD|nr:hypothetical protein [Halobellus sp. DFY28]